MANLPMTQPQGRQIVSYYETLKRAEDQLLDFIKTDLVGDFGAGLGDRELLEELMEAYNAFPPVKTLLIKALNERRTPEDMQYYLRKVLQATSPVEKVIANFHQRRRHNA